MPAKPIFRRAPLMDASYLPLPLGSISPEGWLRAQLLLQSQALRDALSDRWPDLADKRSWRAPNESDWPADSVLLSAVLPLGHLLADAQWIDASYRRIQWAMDAQREDGCLPPFGEGDAQWCARAALMQVFAQYHAVTADKQVLVHMLRYGKYAWDQMQVRPLGMQASARAGELLQTVLWLYRATEKPFLLKLAQALQAQSVDWTAFCHTMPIKTPMEKQISWSKMQQGMHDPDGDVRSFHAQTYHQAHALNLAMGLKTPSLIAQWTGGIKHAEAFDVGYEKLMRFHGTAIGMFGGDALLSGASPSRGAMNAAISELMTTLESMLASLGKANHGDILERLAFNALPAAYSADMRAWQRIQQPNQIDCVTEKHAWYSEAADANCFSSDLTDVDQLSMHHGFPRFAASLWMAEKDGGLAAMSYAPCTVRARAGKASVRIEVQSAYPFDGKVSISIHAHNPVTFPLHLRIPAWAQGATLHIGEEQHACQPGTFAVLSRTWQPDDTVTLTLPMQVSLSNWYHHSGALSLGALLLAHAPEAKGNAAGAWPQDSPWAYALLRDQESVVHVNAAQQAPFGPELTLTVETKAVRLPSWRDKGGVADAPPIAPDIAGESAVSLTLIPYGATSLRIAQFPIAQESDHDGRHANWKD